VAKHLLIAARHKKTTPTQLKSSKPPKTNPSIQSEPETSSKESLATRFLTLATRFSTWPTWYSKGIHAIHRGQQGPKVGQRPPKQAQPLRKHRQDPKTTRNPSTRAFPKRYCIPFKVHPESRSTSRFEPLTCHTCWFNHAFLENRFPHQGTKEAGTPFFPRQIAVPAYGQDVSMMKQAVKDADA
jgi:hypothetical protein